jgi:formylglycine-generating enzyme required for sulfatase activity
MIKKSNTLPVGYRLHQYRIEGVLGAGGFGITYKAVHEALQTRAAIKEYFPVEWSYRDRDEVNVLANTQGASPTSEAGQDACYGWGLERFLNEAQTLAQVNHPGVVRVRDFFEANGTAYIVMDYEDGEPLSQTLQREKILSEEQIRRLVGDVLPALEAVHAQGYLHRDLKPANLYRRADGRTILIDFGAARQALGRRSKSVTSVFSPGYSPIEQYLVEGKGYGPWTDIYAVGAVLYHCVAGISPMEAPARVLDDPLRPAEELAAGRYSQGLLRLIDRAMAVRPEKRFQTVAQMRVALEAPPDDHGEHTVKLEKPLLRSDPHRSGVKPPLESSAPARKEDAPSARKPWLWIAGLLATIVAVAGGVAVWKVWPVSTPQNGQAKFPSDPPAPTGPPTAPQPGQIYFDPVANLELVWVPPGCFVMGSPESEPDRSINEPAHQVCLKGFWISKTEVTNAQFQQIKASQDSGAYDTYGLNAPNQPVVRVSWLEAVAYADALANKTGRRFRLPTEAEWEYAARAGKTSARAWGDDSSQACRQANLYDETARKALKFTWANYPCEDGQVVAAPVGQYQANPFGLHDLLGNVAEWTCSEYDNNYAGGETHCADRNAAAAGGRRVLRGGSWSDSPNLVRFAYRFPASAEYRKFDLGFRLVLEP